MTDSKNKEKIKEGKEKSVTQIDVAIEVDKKKVEEAKKVLKETFSTLAQGTVLCATDSVLAQGIAQGTVLCVKRIFL